MALTELKADVAAELDPDVYADDNDDGLQLINSLREIPLVDASADFDSILSDRVTNLTASIFSTPRYDSAPNSATRARFDDYSFDDSKFPFSDVDTTEEDGDDDENEHKSDRAHHKSKSPSSSPNNMDSVTSRGSRTAEPPTGNTSASSRSFASAQGSPPASFSQTSNQEQKQLDHITKGAVALESMAQFIEVWAPTAHNVVITAAAMQRDAVAFAAALEQLLSSRSSADPQSFANQFYQLREAYASLVSCSGTAAYSSSSWTRASTKLSKPETPRRDQDLETTWDDRQLVDSFMTLLRTSPGFIASAFSQLSTYEAMNFCADEDGSALNTLFHGMLGSAEQYRPEFFAQLLLCTVANTEVLTKALLSKFLALSMGTLTQASSAKLERFLRSVANMSVSAARESPLADFEPILHACLPIEFIKFVNAATDISKHDPAFTSLACAHLTAYTQRLITSPHQFGVLTDTYIGERLTKLLNIVALRVCEALPALVQNLPRLERCETLFSLDELVIVKGSDILQLYQSLLPARGGLQGMTASSPSSESDDDEWCLENIRSDLIPVIRELAHSSGRADGWQVFKIGADGLVTDLSNDMGLAEEDAEDDEMLRVLCDAVGKHHGSLWRRLAAARTDAELRGDHLALLQLGEIGESPTIEPYVGRVDQVISTRKQRCRILRKMLDQAAKEQHRERERLISLLSILDSARIHVWYEAEVRPCTPYYRAREFLKMLYPHARSDGDEPDKGSDTNLPDLTFGPVSGTKSRRLSILSSHSAPEPPFFNRDVFAKPKLSDREVENVLIYMRRNRIRNVCPAEELFQRALVEIGHLSRKLIERDYIAGYVTFKRDRHYQTQHNQAQQQLTLGSMRNNKRLSQHRRSSLGLFDFFDSGNYAQQTAPVTLHSSTSTQFLGLSSSHDSLRSASHPTESASAVGPPTHPRLSQVSALLLSDLGHGFMNAVGTETDNYMQQTGRMLLEGDGHKYQPLLDDLSLAMSPDAKLAAVESLVQFTQAHLRRKQGMSPSRSDVIHELGRVLGREAGTLYRDLGTISFLLPPNVLEPSLAFADVCDAAQNVLEWVIARSTDYAARFLRYYLETKTTAAPQMSSMGIADSAAIYAFCAKCGSREAQRKLADLYLHFPSLPLEIRPLSRPTSVIDSTDSSLIRGEVVQHWLGLASRI